MSVFDFFRKLFVPGEVAPRSNSDNFNSGLVNDFRNPIWDNDESDDSDLDFRSPFGGQFSFNIYSNPLEIHRFFEQQMNEMLKNFMMIEPSQEFHSFFDSDSDQFSDLENPFEGRFNQLPGIEKPVIESPRSLRERLLKPEYNNVESSSDKIDSDLDGKFDTNEICSALEKKDSVVPIWTPNKSEKSVLPHNGQNIFSSSRSVVSRIVRRPDGSIEREEIIKNSDGSEKKTVSRKLGEQEYSVSTFVDSSGVEQRTENFNNIDPEKLKEFNKVWENQENHKMKWWQWWEDNEKPLF